MTPEDAALLLRDIRGLDPISWWPPAPGWWLLAAGAATLLALIVWVVREFRRYPVGSWNRDARRQLRALKQRIPQLAAREIAGDVTELLRRIAIARCGREAAAGLAGEAWLDWLSRHDPAGFDWRANGRALLELSYAPRPEAEVDPAMLVKWIDASVAWTADRGPCRDV